jgi:hypothetical protein
MACVSKHDKKIHNNYTLKYDKILFVPETCFISAFLSKNKDEDLKNIICISGDSCGIFLML